MQRSEGVGWRGSLCLCVCVCVCVCVSKSDSHFLLSYASGDLCAVDDFSPSDFYTAR